MKIVRLNFSDDEYQIAYDQAIDHGYANIQDYLRSILFNEEPDDDIDFEALLNKFEKAIQNKSKGVEFRVRDCFDDSDWSAIPSQKRRDLGRMIFRKVQKNGWCGIIPIRKDSANAQWYKVK